MITTKHDVPRQFRTDLPRYDPNARKWSPWLALTVAAIGSGLVWAGIAVLVERWI